MTTEDAQAARIKELEDRLAKAEELLTACVKMLVELVDESDRGPGWNQLSTHYATASGFQATKKR